MKKMNLFFLPRVFDGINSRKGLMTFVLLFLFGLGFNSLSAQYVSTEVATQRLKDASKVLTQNVEILKNSGDQVAINRGNLKLLIVSRMLTDLKEGASVKNIVEKYIGSPNVVTAQDYLMASDDPKGDYMKKWKDEILQMLKL